MVKLLRSMLRLPEIQDVLFARWILPFFRSFSHLFHQDDG
jgi:hypothetical protein